MISPPELFRAVLVQAGLVQMPVDSNALVKLEQVPKDNTTICYVSSLPDEPDQAIRIVSTGDRFFGKCQVTGERLVHHNLKLLFRALTYPINRDLGLKILDLIDSFTRTTVVVGGVSFPIQSLYSSGVLQDIGEDITRRRYLSTLNVSLVPSVGCPKMG